MKFENDTMKLVHDFVNQLVIGKPKAYLRVVCKR